MALDLSYPLCHGFSFFCIFTILLFFLYQLKGDALSTCYVTFVYKYVANINSESSL